MTQVRRSEVCHPHVDGSGEEYRLRLSQSYNLSYETSLLILSEKKSIVIVLRVSHALSVAWVDLQTVHPA